MGYEVRGVCLAEVLDARAALCASWPSSATVSVDGSSAASWCGSFDVDGIVVVVERYSSGGAKLSSTFARVEHELVEGCTVQADFVSAGLEVFVAVLSVWAAAWGLWKIKSTVDAYAGWGRGDAS